MPVSVQCLSANTLPAKRASPWLFTRDDRGLITSYKQPILLRFNCWKFLASAFSGVATQPGQTFRDVVTLLGPSLLWQSGRRFFF